MRRVAHVVLDEADRMLEVGFLAEVEAILARVPAPHQTLCFTATWPRSVEKVAATYMAATAARLVVAEAEGLQANKAVSQVGW